jgi:hypothetical protein
MARRSTNHAKRPRGVGKRSKRLLHHDLIEELQRVLGLQLLHPLCRISRQTDEHLGTVAVTSLLLYTFFYIPIFYCM